VASQCSAWTHAHRMHVESSPGICARLACMLVPTHTSIRCQHAELHAVRRSTTSGTATGTRSARAQRSSPQPSRCLTHLSLLCCRSYVKRTTTVICPVLVKRNIGAITGARCAQTQRCAVRGHASTQLTTYCFYLQVLTDMAQSIGSKPWWSINTGYYQTAGGQKTSVQSTVNYRGYTTVPNNGLCWQVRARSAVGPELT